MLASEGGRVRSRDTAGEEGRESARARERVRGYSSWKGEFVREKESERNTKGRRGKEHENQKELQWNGK